MSTYHFRYANDSGGVIRSTQMQCAADAEAIRQARAIMADPYARLEIYEGEREVYSCQPDARSRVEEVRDLI